MDNFIALKNELSAIMDKGRATTSRLGYDTSAERLLGMKDALGKKELMIVTIGEARRGKSTLLNAIIDQEKPLFPVDVNVCTNVVTVLRYAEEESVMVCIEDPEDCESVRTEYIDREDIYKYVSEKGNPNNYRNVKGLYISLPNEFLKGGVVLVDTPGVGSLNVSHAEVTYNFLPYADMVLFVSDVGSGYTETELNFLKKSYSYCKNIIFPVTKKDTSADYQTIVEDNIYKISKTIGLPREKINIIPVSANAKLRYLKTGNQAMYQNSNFRALEHCMWSIVAKNKVNLMIRPFVVEMKTELDKVYNGIVTQYNTLSEDSSKVSSLMDSYEEIGRRMKKYQEEGASWRTELNNYHLKELSLNVDEALRGVSARAIEYLNESVMNLEDKVCKEENYTQILMVINDIISAGTIEIKEMISNSINVKVDEIRGKLGLTMDINESVYEKIRFEKEDSLNITFAKKKKSDMIIGNGRNISLNVSGGTMGGGILGGVLGATIGLFLGNPVAGISLGYKIGGGVGTILGGAKGVTDSFKNSAADINTVKNTISKYISESTSKIKNILSRANVEIVKEINTTLDKEIKQNIQELQENQARVKANINTEKADVPKKKEELKRQLKEIKAVALMLEGYVKKLAQVTFAVPKPVVPVVQQQEERTAELSKPTRKEIKKEEKIKRKLEKEEIRQKKTIQKEPKQSGIIKRQTEKNKTEDNSPQGYGFI